VPSTSRAALLIARWQLVGADQQFAGFAPTLEPALERLRLDAGVAKPGGRTLAELLSFLAHDDDGLAAVVRRPLLNGPVIPTRGAWQQASIGSIVVVDADIDQRRALRRADQAGELIR